MNEQVRAWRPRVPLVREVLHATFEQHAYPAHTHDVWTVLLIDEGAVSYRMDGAAHEARPASVSLLPPHVPHDGRSAVRGTAFRKRVLYLDEGWLPPSAVGAAAARPFAADARVQPLITALHATILHPGDELVAEHGVLRLADLVQLGLGGARAHRHDAPIARRLRQLLDDRFTEAITLDEAARMLGAHPSHLVRSFSAAYGIPPHRYVTGRRVDLARRLLLSGHTAAASAVQAGFHDQSHLTRHFRRTLGTTPAAFAAAGRAA
ncbi:AraC family transcriptional regulator [Herbiconiux moechotypicola]|uniref:AraC family transcriptional regulator n=1 Tax=Herbiconiux moechotypicola TaxID=637393 RepID=A0ABN3E672_9MICO|nr:AraC family transcriptional regulator [Herbiconiux moechotypicola]MCS5731779.1 AraC family transcriptional regulator [Herbiconiux moechotypicola]